jgi:hypothetical protein
MQINLGLLVVGSLYWEGMTEGECARILKDYRQTDEENPKAKMRRDWRLKNLSPKPEDTHDVRVPIRYGRKSRSRGDSYTMVFSPECVNRLGSAKAIKCSQPIKSSEDLIPQAEEVWIAEDGQEKPTRSLSAGWGSVVLLVNPKFLDHTERPEREKLLADWAAQIKKSPSYGNLRLLAKELTAGFKSELHRGRLQIPWPQLVAGGDAPFDLLLATATNPEIDGALITDYPTPAAIARAWTNNKNYAFYFWCNEASGITTADDRDIRQHLLSAGEARD